MFIHINLVVHLRIYAAIVKWKIKEETYNLEIIIVTKGFFLQGRGGGAKPYFNCLRVASQYVMDARLS